MKNIKDCCQVDDFEIIGDEMLFRVEDSDCEHYFEEFQIEQREISGSWFNVINLKKIGRYK